MKAWIPLTVAAVVATGCGSGPATTAGPSSTPPTAATTTPPPADETPSPTAGPVITVTIAAGSVTPTNAQAEAAVGQPIVLAVSSDVADSIHPHPTLSETIGFAGEVHLGAATEVYRPKRKTPQPH